MTDLDLDELERVVEDAKAKSLGSLAFSIDTVVIGALIQRVREAEALVQHIGVSELENDLYQRLRVSEPENQGLRQALNEAKRLYSERIAQLERVREAGKTFADEPAKLSRPIDEPNHTEHAWLALLDALRALEEPVKL